MIQPWTMAQGSADSDALDVVVALGYLSAAAVIAAVVFWLLRRWLGRHDGDQAVATGFTLAQLRQLHRDGELTDEQFAAARAALIARGLASMGGLDPADDGSPDDEGSRPPSAVRGTNGGQPNAGGLSDGAINPDDGGSSDKSGGGSGGDDAPPKRDK